jgi:hypothetical protein
MTAIVAARARDAVRTALAVSVDFITDIHRTGRSKASCYALEAVPAC